MDVAYSDYLIPVPVEKLTRDRAFPRPLDRASKPHASPKMIQASENSGKTLRFLARATRDSEVPLSLDFQPSTYQKQRTRKPLFSMDKQTWFILPCASRCAMRKTKCRGRGWRPRACSCRHCENSVGGILIPAPSLSTSSWPFRCLSAAPFP